MAEDIFSQFYNLFKNGDAVNWQLAEQISKHILKDEEESFSLEHEENKTDIQSIFRAVQINLESKIDTEIIDIKSVNKNEWASWLINSSKHFDFSINFLINLAFLYLPSKQFFINISIFLSSTIPHIFENKDSP